MPWWWLAATQGDLEELATLPILLALRAFGVLLSLGPYDRTARDGDYHCTTQISSSLSRCRCGLTAIVRGSEKEKTRRPTAFAREGLLILALSPTFLTPKNRSAKFITSTDHFWHLPEHAHPYALQAAHPSVNQHWPASIADLISDFDMSSILVCDRE